MKKEEVIFVLKDKNIIMIGGDKRFSCLFDMLKVRVKNCVILNTDTEVFVSEYFLKEFDVVILPLPVTKDGIYINSSNEAFRMSLKSVIENIRDDAIVFGGIINDSLKNMLKQRKIRCFDYYTDEDFLILNSHLTALGTVKLISNSATEKLKNKKALITGYGHLSKALCSCLDDLEMNVSVVARNVKSREDALYHGFDAYDFPVYEDVLQKFDYIFNTVASKIFSPENIKKLRKDTVFVELASKPFGTDPEYFASFDKKYICGQSLPGKYYPEECAKGIYDVIVSCMTAGGDNN